MRLHTSCSLLRGKSAIPAQAVKDRIHSTHAVRTYTRESLVPLISRSAAHEFSRISLGRHALCCRDAHLASRKCFKVVCKAAEDDVRDSSKADTWISGVLDDFPSLGEGLGSGFLLFLWAAFLVYALRFSPNQTPVRDSYFIQKLVGLQRDSFQINTLYTMLFNAMGIYPLMFLALIQPSGKSSNKIPSWPFTTLSFGLGFLSLGLYFALWKPSADIQAPPPKQQLEGIQNLSLKMTESTITSVLIFLIVLGLVGTAGVAALSAEQWREFFHLFDESRLVHVSTLDFLLLSTFSGFWISNDAQQRKWTARDRWVPILSAIPLLGPAIYLVLRPKAN